MLYIKTIKSNYLWTFFFNYNYVWEDNEWMTYRITFFGVLTMENERWYITLYLWINWAAPLYVVLEDWLSCLGQADCECHFCSCCIHAKIAIIMTTFSVTKGKHTCDLHNIPLCLGFFVIVECWGNGTLCFITLLLILL